MLHRDADAAAQEIHRDLTQALDYIADRGRELGVITIESK
jgi:hypothetical protein